MQDSLSALLGLSQGLLGADAVIAFSWTNDDTAVVRSAWPPLPDPRDTRNSPNIVLSLDRRAIAAAGGVDVEWERPRRLVSSALRFSLPSAPRAALAITADGSGPAPGGLLALWLEREPDVATLTRVVRDPQLIRRSLGSAFLLGASDLAADRMTSRLDAVLDTVRQGIVFVDADDETGVLNAAAGALLGLPAGAAAPAELAVRMAQLREGAVNAPLLLERARALLLDAESRVEDWVWELDTPRRRVLRVSSVPVRGALARGRLWTFDDVTQESDAVRRLSESEGRFRAVVDNAAIGVAVADDDGRLVHTNVAFQQFLGYAAGELTGVNTASLSPPDDAWITRRAVAAIRSGAETSATVEKRFVRKDGAVRWGTLTLSRIPLPGGSLGLLGLVADVTDRKCAEAEVAGQRAFLSTALDSLSDGVVACDAAGTLTLINRAAREMHGLPEAPIPPEEWADHYSLFEANGRTPLAPADVPLYRALRGEDVTDAEIVIAPTGQAPRTLLASGRLILDADGQSLGAVVAMRDVTERARAEAALRESEERYRGLVDLSPDAVLVHVAGIIRYANTATSALLGEPDPDALVGRPVLDLVHPDDRAMVVARIGRIVEEGDVAALQEERLVRRDGSVVTCEIVGAPVHYEGSTGVQAIVRDVTSRQRAEAELRESERRFRSVLETVSSAAITLDAAGGIVFANDAFLDLSGWAREDVLGHRWRACLVPPGRGEGSVAAMWASPATLPPHDEHEIMTRDGQRRTIVWDNTVLLDAGGAIAGMASLGRDVTEQLALQKRLAALAEHDELTGLLNRRGFLRMASQQIKVSRRLQRRGAMLYLDLDGFKPINDQFGHREGDQALRAMARVLVGALRDGDLVARMGGDEFVILAHGVDGAGDANMLAARLGEHLEEHNAAAKAAGRQYDIHCSMGVAAIDADDDVDRLLERADAALYARKIARRIG